MVDVSDRLRRSTESGDSMIGWIILGSVVMLIVVLYLVRIGVIFRYNKDDGFEVYLKVAFVKVLIYSTTRKKDVSEVKREKHVKKQKDKVAKDEKEKGSSLERFKENYNLIRGTIRRLGSAARIDFLYIRFVAAAEDDPAKAAIMYGKAWAAEGIIIGILENNIKVRKKEISIEVDYMAVRPTISFQLQLTAAIAGILRAVFGLLADMISVKRSKTKTLHEKGGA
ncbi:MAG: DUF2953 domain-containing protein [Eubacteriales bacterium]|jgi:hypothetical protein